MTSLKSFGGSFRSQINSEATDLNYPNLTMEVKRMKHLNLEGCRSICMMEKQIISALKERRREKEGEESSCDIKFIDRFFFLDNYRQIVHLIFTVDNILQTAFVLIDVGSSKIYKKKLFPNNFLRF